MNNMYLGGKSETKTIASTNKPALAPKLPDPREGSGRSTASVNLVRISRWSEERPLNVRLFMLLIFLRRILDQRWINCSGDWTISQTISSG